MKLDRLIGTVMKRGVANPELATEVRGLQQMAVTRLDSRIGELFAELKKRGVYDRAMIIVTADHGEAFGEHGIVEHSKDVYEELVRVPLIVKFPGQTEGRVVSTRASSVHVAGIIAEALAGTDAETLADVFRRVPDRIDGTVLAENYYSRNKDLKRFGDRFRRRRYALYEGDLKLIAGSDNSLELYNLKSDPGETEDLAESLPDDAARLLGGLQKRLNGTTAYQGDRRMPGSMTAKQRSASDALGYSGSEEDPEEDPKEGNK